MFKLKITIQKEKDGEMVDHIIEINEIESCTEITDIESQKIDYAYSSPNENNPEYRYFQIRMSGATKLLAAAGDVELLEIPQAENSIEKWDKKIK